jgi:predicted HicB family RNase H-like nuclease
MSRLEKEIEIHKPHPKLHNKAKMKSIEQNISINELIKKVKKCIYLDNMVTLIMVI